MRKVPTFKPGEPGHAARLNELCDAVRELQDAVQVLAKPATRKRATKKADPEVGG